MTTISEHSYIGSRGYTIPKSVLSMSDIVQLKERLTLSPLEAPGMKKMKSIAASNQPKIYTYRESKDKFYVPRFYGIEAYGNTSSKLPPGDSIHVPFQQTLRDYQEHIVSVYMNHVDSTTGGGGILEVPCGRGKCLGYNTPVMMHDGTIKPVQDIQVGELLMGDDSTPRTVLSLARGREKMYQIRDKITNESYTVNESHILSLKHFHNHSVKDISVHDFLQWSTREQENWRGYRVPIEYSSVQNTNDSLQDAYEIGKSETNILPYTYGSAPVRKSLLAGILDNPKLSCTVENTRIHITASQQSLQTGIIQLARSLGIHAYSVQESNGIYLSGMELCTLPTKIISTESILSTMPTLLYEIQIIPLDEDDYYGFEIDGNRRFVLGDFTVTHNTIMALNICSKICRKTLILVHKEFLMNQWIERIRDFLPSARVGIIQAKKFDIEDKDIVIGMIQTLYSRDYPGNTFQSFGLTIIDEVHRIGSEEFSKTLTKIATPFMLGISATVDRKDGLTEILHMFIGPKIYQEERKDANVVQVRAIQYEDPRDAEFNDVEYDFRGNVKYSTMVSRISDHIPRCHFLVQVIHDLVQENDEKQIMILSHKRDLLTFLYEHINERKIASCGYYVGGMKQSALQATETKHIVLATYAMAAEALDIKSLNTLVMVSPKTDIVQSVGRILRTSGEGKIIVDIIDPHDVFQNQWKKRKTFYNKSEYQIRMVKKEHYPGMDIDWNTDTNWKLLSYRKRNNTSSSSKQDTPCTSTNNNHTNKNNNKNHKNHKNNDEYDDDDETNDKPRTCFISTDNIVW